ncbi:hypothetical protein ACFVZE_34565 [Streptomyces anulatus]|uniref:hypothetical protein n=1 Tax=Streptomyces anulatus TaxID=1892 RepID=UPI0036DBFEA7
MSPVLAVAEWEPAPGSCLEVHSPGNGSDVDDIDGQLCTVYQADFKGGPAVITSLTTGHSWQCSYAAPYNLGEPSVAATGCKVI